MIEADVLLRGGKGDPIMAHPPETESDITLQEWLDVIVNTDKGIKLDFKRYFKTKTFVYTTYTYIFVYVYHSYFLTINSFTGSAIFW